MVTKKRLITPTAQPTHRTISAHFQFEKVPVLRQQHPVRRTDLPAGAGVILDVQGFESGFGGQTTHDGEQVHEAVGHVHRQDPVLVQMGEIDLQALPSQEMDGDGVAAEGVDGQHVEALRLTQFKLALQNIRLILEHFTKNAQKFWSNWSAHQIPLH